MRFAGPRLRLTPHSLARLQREHCGHTGSKRRAPGSNMATQSPSFLTGGRHVPWPGRPSKLGNASGPGAWSACARNERGRRNRATNRTSEVQGWSWPFKDTPGRDSPGPSRRSLAQLHKQSRRCRLDDRISAPAGVRSRHEGKKHAHTNALSFRR